MAGLLERLFGKLPERRKHVITGKFWVSESVTALTAGRGFNQQIVGESFYQRAIEDTAGGRSKYQVNVYHPVELREGTWEGKPSIQAYLSGRRCGSIPANEVGSLLEELRPLLALQKPVVAKGRIMGGFEDGHFGVEISLSRPLKQLTS